MTFKFIRFLILALRLIPILFFPTFFSVEELGLYGVLFGYIYTFIYFIGFEFWFLYNRKFTIVNTIQEKQRLLKEQNQKYFLNYIVALPIFILLIANYPMSLVLSSIVILIAYHLIQELNRIFIHLEDHLNAALLQLIQTLWVIILPCGLVDSISDLFIYIMFFAIFALFYGIAILYLKYKILFIAYFDFKIDLKIYKEVFLIAFSAILIKFFLYLPRFILEWKEQLDMAGIFTYFQSISMVSEYFLYFFIQALFIPKLLKNKQDKALINSFKKQMQYGSLFLFVFICLGAYILMKYIIKNDIYYQHMDIFIIILFATLIIAYSGFYTSLNYINHDDRSYKVAIIYSGLFALPIFLVSLFLGDKNNFIYIMCIDFLLYAFLVLFFRIHYAKKFL